MLGAAEDYRLSHRDVLLTRSLAQAVRAERCEFTSLRDEAVGVGFHYGGPPGLWCTPTVF